MRHYGRDSGGDPLYACEDCELRFCNAWDNGEYGHEYPDISEPFQCDTCGDHFCPDHETFEECYECGGQHCRVNAVGGSCGSWTTRNGDEVFVCREHGGIRVWAENAPGGPSDDDEDWDTSEDEEDQDSLPEHADWGSADGAFLHAEEAYDNHDWNAADG